MSQSPIRSLIALAASVSMGTAAFALDNTLVDDYWDTTGYVNQPAHEVASPALADAFATPLAVATSAGTAQESAFSSWFFSWNASPALPGFEATGPGFLLLFK